jgi:hypothetical protein
VREVLRASTQLADERLDALVDDLESQIAKIGHVAAMRTFGRPGETAQQYDEMADALRDLIATQERIHPVVREGVGLPKSVLAHHLKVAEDMAAAHREYVTKGRPAVEGQYRNGVARGADRIIRVHCSGISKGNLRRAVAAVLASAGYNSPNPKKDPTKFDQMLQPLVQPFPVDRVGPDLPFPGSERRRAERVARDLEARPLDVPI